MADEHQGNLCFRFILQKFKQPQHVSNIRKSKCCLKSRCFVTLLNDNRLFIENFQNAETTTTTVENVDWFILQDEADIHNTVEIGVLDRSGKLLIFKELDGVYTAGEGVDIKQEVQKEVSDICSTEPVLFKGDDITLCINNATIVKCSIKDRQCNVVSKISLPSAKENFHSFEIVDNICAVLDSQRLLFHNVDDGEVLCEVDTRNMGLDVTSVQAWSIADDLTYLAVVLQSGDLQLIELQAYCSSNPTVLKRGKKSQQLRDQQLHSSLCTTQYGDIPWRDKLLSMHVGHESIKKESTASKTPKTTTTHTLLSEPIKRSKVTGFQSRSKQKPVLPQCTRVAKAPDEVQGYSVENISLDQRDISVVYSYNDTCVLCQIEFSTFQWKIFRLNKGEVLVPSSDTCLPHIIVTEKHLEGLMTRPGMDQEQFVNELMVYGGAALADTVCHLNNWGRSSIPIHTLQVGLKHRQLDTVTFFLKSKERIFTSTHSSMVKHKQDSENPSNAMTFSHLDSLVQLEPAVNLLIESVRGSIGDQHSLLFGKQILDTSLDFLYELLLDSLSVSESTVTEQESVDLQQATDKLLEYIENTRGCIHTLEQQGVSVSRSESLSPNTVSGASPSSISVATASSTDKDSPDGTSLFSQWDKMDMETIIEDGLMKNMVPDLQQYLLQRKEHSRAGYSEIKSTCISLVTNYIKYGNMDKAKEMLMRLGLSVSEELWKIALNALDFTLCTSITEELLRTTALNKDQVAMVTFFKELNEIYPCRNFEKIQRSQHHVKDSDSHEVQRLKNLINQTSKFDLTENCGNLTYHASTDLGTSQYNEVLLDWVQHWDSGTRDLVKLDVLIYKPGSDISVFSKELIWEYLVSRNMTDVIVAWIHNSFTSNRPGSHTEKEVKWPVSHLGKVSVDFVNQLDLCTVRSKNETLNAFARHGVFSREVLATFHSLLKQLSELGGPLQLPHPLEQCQAPVLNQFHSDMVHHCIQNNLQYFLWLYVSYHGLDVDWVEHVCDGFKGTSWLPLFLKFLSIAKSETLRQSMYEGSLMNAVTVWDVQSASVGELLQSGHPLAALATLMYSQHSLQQVTFVTQQLEAFDGLSSETVERALQGFPKLQVTLFPASVTDLPHTDVSIYQLLVGNAPFDPSKLFGWQTTNTCAGEDSIKEMPYFSHPGMVTKYGYSEHLRYNYYLKQARPSFAFVTFLAEELKNGGSTLPTKRLAVAIGTSLWTGVKHFHNPQISSSCVLFQELLGHDSIMLRLYIQVGSEILAYRNQAVTGTMDRRRDQVKKNEHDVVEMLLDCIQDGKRFAPTVLGALEAAILAAITRENLKLFSYEASKHWTIAVLFCHLHYLPYTTVFLESCAESKQWLPFIWFAQIHQYPREQLQNLLHKFQSPNLQEHLRYVLTKAELRTFQVEEKKVQAKHRSDRVAKDVRSNLYSRIGLVKGTESEASSTSDDEESQARLSGILMENENLEDDAVLEMSYDSAPGDVFGVVFAAQSSKCPWKSLLLHSVILRNCLFAELAASFNEASVLPCLCSWLVAMMDISEHAQFLENYGKSPWRYNMHTLDAILDLFICKKWGSLLVTGFDIFQQNSPLLPFLQFYAEFTERQNFRNCRLLLDEFKESVFQFNHEKSVQAMEYIGDASWLEQTTYRIIQFMLTATPSVHKVAQLLKILDRESITLVFKNVDPDFRRQSQMLQCIEEGEIDKVNFTALLTQSSRQFESECLSVIDQLVSKNQFGEARKFAKIAGICAHHVTLQQLKQEKERISGTELWQSRQARFKFYRDCTLKFNKYKIPAEQIAEFFKKEVESVASQEERADIYALCLKCMEEGVIDEGSDDSSESRTQIYRSMWLCRILAKQENRQTLEMPESRLDLFSDTSDVENELTSTEKTELMFYGKMPRNSDQPNMTEDEVKAVQQLAGELLNKGKVSESCRLLTVFNVYSQDLAVILTCIRLSMGSLSLDTMTPDMLHLLRSRPGNLHRQSIAAPVALLRNSSTISLMSNIQPVIDSVSIENEAKISAMECLLNHLNDGRPTCIRIITAFKIAAVLYIGYDDVITGEDYFILKSLLKTNCSAKFRLAADFLGTSSLSAEQVAGFLSDAILQSYRVSLGETGGDQELFFDPGENFADFHQIVRLCQEPSFLGNRLVDSVASMAGDLEETNDKVLTLQTELLILAHECYTASCDMEGVSNILRAARILTAHLQAAGEHQLMTRLLTGVGRYNEMTYIFDALQQDHQFELLLGKGKEKEIKLKTAILDYLKRYHPDDTDTYTMVALKFMMYREIAQLLEDSASKHLDKLKGKPLENTTETQALLQKVAQFLSEAAESYIKDNCLRHAQACVRKARLVALQVKYLASNQQFINLTTKGANLLIADHPVFTEAYIISEAYKQKESWALALCNNVIKLGNMKYLQEFRSHIRLTPTLIEDAVDRYQQCAEKSQQGPGNIKKLLQYCKDVKVQYRLAKQLGLRDVIMNLEKGDAKSYISDFAMSVT